MVLGSVTEVYRNYKRREVNQQDPRIGSVINLDK